MVDQYIQAMYEAHNSVILDLVRPKSDWTKQSVGATWLVINKLRSHR